MTRYDMENMAGKGPKVIAVALLLVMAGEGAGYAARKEFITSKGSGRAYERVVNPEFLKKMLGQAKKSRKNRTTNKIKVKLKTKKRANNGDSGFSVFSVEKVIADLTRENYIKSLPKSRIVPADYSIVCENLYDLFRVFNFIYEAEIALPDHNHFKRLNRFINSPFFKKQFDDRVLDLIYYFDLWDEHIYPLDREYYRIIMGDAKFLSLLPQYCIRDSTDHRGGMYGLTSRRQGYVGKVLPKYFRETCYGVGPIHYEINLKKLGFPRLLFEKLKFYGPLQGISGYVLLSEFLRKYIVGGSDAQATSFEPIDTWFNSFWYGSVGYFRNILQRYDKVLNLEIRADNLCILPTELANNGHHGFENFRPFIIMRKLIHLSHGNKQGKELEEKNYTLRFHDQLMSEFGHFPKYTEYMQLNRPKGGSTFLTEEGRLFVYEGINQIPKKVWYPPSLIYFIEYFLKFPCKLSVQPSLTLNVHDGITGKMNLLDNMLVAGTGVLQSETAKRLISRKRNLESLLSHRILSTRIEFISGWNSLSEEPKRI